MDYLDNIWHQFTFADDFFEDRDAPSDEQTNIDFGTSSSIDNWKVFNKRGLHLIHLNINSLTLYNVCSVHRGVFSTSGGYHEYIGGYHEYIGGCSVHRGES